MLPVVLRPFALAQDDSESASITSPIIDKGDVGSSGVPPKGVEPLTQSTSPELVARKRKLLTRLTQRGGGTRQSLLR